MERYRHLWQYKKSALNLGETEYKVVRNWTPRKERPAGVSQENQPSQQQQEQQQQQHHQVEQPEERDDDVLPLTISKSFAPKPKVPTAHELKKDALSPAGNSTFAHRMKGLLTKIKDQAGVNAPAKSTDTGSESPRPAPENDSEPGVQNGDSEGQEIVKLNQTKNFELGFSNLGYIAESSAEPEDLVKLSKTEPVQERPVSDHKEHLEQQDAISFEDESTYNEPPDPSPEEEMELHRTNLPDSQGAFEDQVRVDSLSVSKQSKPRVRKRQQKCVLAVKLPKQPQKGPLSAAKRGTVADILVSSNAEALKGQEKVGRADFSTSQATLPLSLNKKPSTSEKKQSGRGRKRLLATKMDENKAADLSDSSRSTARERTEESKAADKRGRKSSSALQSRKRQRESPLRQQASTSSKSALADRISQQPFTLPENDVALEAFAFRPNDEASSGNVDSDGEIDVVSVQEPTKPHSFSSTSEERVPPLFVGDASGDEQANADYLPPKKRQKKSQPSSLTTAKPKKTLNVHGGRDRKKKDGYCVKLWRPKNVHRTRKDLNELDVCMSIYDEVINEMLESTDDAEAQEMLIEHWKHTQKGMLSVIKKSHSMTVLAKEYKKEKSKSSALQKKLVSKLSDLKQSGEQYRMAMAKATKFKKAKQMSALEKEIQTEVHELRPLLANIFFS